MSILLGQVNGRKGVDMYSFFMFLGLIAGVVLIGSALIASIKDY